MNTMALGTKVWHRWNSLKYLANDTKLDIISDAYSINKRIHYRTVKGFVNPDTI